jgi:hypothetical protein
MATLAISMKGRAYPAIRQKAVRSRPDGQGSFMKAKVTPLSPR